MSEAGGASAYRANASLPMAMVGAARACCELARARIEIAVRKPPGLLSQAPVAVRAGGAGDPRQRVELVAWAIGAAACRVPWRADCLVRARAAQRWLAALGVPTELSIGVRKDETGRFGAHAWLTFEDEVIIGGDVTPYTLLLTAADPKRPVSSRADG